MANVWPGEPYPLGATYDGSGTNFSVYSFVADAVELCLFDEEGSETRVDFAVPSHRQPVQFQLPIRGGTSGTATVPVAGARVRAEVSLADTTTQKLGHRAYYISNADTDGYVIVDAVQLVEK